MQNPQSRNGLETGYEAQNGYLEDELKQDNSRTFAIVVSGAMSVQGREDMRSEKRFR